MKKMRHVYAQINKISFSLLSDMIHKSNGKYILKFKFHDMRDQTNRCSRLH